MLSNDFPKLAEDLALISKLAGGQTADSAIVPSVKAHAVRRDSLSHLSTPARLSRMRDSCCHDEAQTYALATAACDLLSSVSSYDVLLIVRLRRQP